MKTAIDAFASLAQETRLAIFRLLIRNAPDGMPAGDIAEALAVPAPTLSFHLSHLANAGLIQSQRQSRSIIYSVAFERVQDLVAYLVEDCCQGRADLCGYEATPCCSLPNPEEIPCHPKK